MCLEPAYAHMVACSDHWACHSQKAMAQIASVKAFIGKITFFKL